MAVRGIGIDVVKVERLMASLERFGTRMEDRLFTPAELAYCRTHKDPLPHLAARFAAKEAALKALGIGGLRLHEVEVEGGGDQPPRLRLHGEAAAAAARDGVELSVSLTHSRDMAAAVVRADPAGSRG